MSALEQTKKIDNEIHKHNKSIMELEQKKKSIIEQVIIEDPIWAKTTWEYDGYSFKCLDHLKEMYECLNKRYTLKISDSISITHYCFQDDENEPYIIHSDTFSEEPAKAFMIIRNFLLARGAQVIINKKSIKEMKKYCEDILKLFKDLEKE